MNVVFNIILGLLVAMAIIVVTLLMAFFIIDIIDEIKERIDRIRGKGGM